MKRSFLVLSLLFTASACAIPFEEAKGRVESASAAVTQHEERIDKLRAEAQRLDQQISAAQGRPEHADEMERLKGRKRQTLDQCNALVDQLSSKVQELEAQLAAHGSHHEVVSVNDSNGKPVYTLRKHDAQPVSTTVRGSSTGPREPFARGGSYYPRARVARAA